MMSYQEVYFSYKAIMVSPDTALRIHHQVVVRGPDLPSHPLRLKLMDFSIRIKALSKLMHVLKGEAFLGSLEYVARFIASIKKELADWTDVMFVERVFAEDASQLNVCKADTLEAFVAKLGSSEVRLQFSLQTEHDFRFQEIGIVATSSQKKVLLSI